MDTPGGKKTAVLIATWLCYSVALAQDEARVPSLTSAWSDRIARARPQHFSHDLHPLFVQLALRRFQANSLADSTEEAAAEMKRCVPNCSYVCGQSSHRDGRIVNGTETDPAEFPWMAGLYLRIKTKRQKVRRKVIFVCGATIINDAYVMTAAHCLKRNSQETLASANLIVRVGDHDFSRSERHQVDYAVARIVSHPNYFDATYDNDIALIRTTKRIKFSDAVKPICLAHTDEEYAGEVATVIGWGSLEDPSSSSSLTFPGTLRKVSVPVIDNSSCRKDTHYFDHTITDNMMCAGYLEGGRDTCQGDSGGSLMLRKGSGSHFAIGIVSFGEGCAEPAWPGVYTRVGRYLNWIAEVTTDSCYCRDDSNQ